MVTADTAPVSVQSKEAWFHEHNPATRPLWVLTEHGTVCAWMSFNSFHSRPAYFPTIEISIYIAESHRRQGHGRRLLAEAIRRAPACGAKTIVGLIWGHNVPSLELFRQFGFTTWGHLPNVAIMDGIERDLEIVGLRVAP
jgi:phosphinothricin acetyltransferase